MRTYGRALITGKIKKCVLTVFLLLCLAGCGSPVDSGDPEYEAQVIVVEGLPDGEKTITMSELRALTQHKLNASFVRTTGLPEKYKMEGPLLADIIAYLGGDLSEYAGVGVQGGDAYYCLVAEDIIESTDLMLAITIDGKKKLEDGIAPARLAAQGQFGPYWVRMVDKITLYKDIPEKNISSVWVFMNLVNGLEPYSYEYYGSKDDSYELGMVFNRLEKVDIRSFFTMKSSDGFKKNEAISMVNERYYIKTEGVDAPTNISPFVKLGMNVKNIAWISMSDDACIFPEQMMKYMPLNKIKDVSGLPLDEVLVETELRNLDTKRFELIGTKGESVTVDGLALAKGILAPGVNGAWQVIWDDSLKLQGIDNLLRIRMVK